jgi:hypothetical protein
MSGEGPSRLRLSAYGKLPLSREFLRFACDGAAARRYSDYLHEVASYCAGLPQEGDNPIRLYMPLEHGGTIAASVWPSTDEDGRRDFPFSIFAQVEGENAVRGPLAFCTAFEAVHRAHSEALAAVANVSDLRSFEETLRGREWSPGPLPAESARKRHEEAAASHDTGAWAARLFGDDGRSFPLALWRLQKVLQVAQGSLARLGDRSPGIRVPMLTDVDLVVQADAWLGLLTGAGTLECSTNVLLGPFGPDGSASLVLLFRPLRPGDFALVAGGSVRGLVDLSVRKELADMAGFDAFRGTVGERLGATHTTLESLPTLLDDIA